MEGKSMRLKVILRGLSGCYQVEETEDGLWVQEVEEGPVDVTFFLEDFPIARFRPHPEDPEALKPHVAWALEALESLEALTAENLRRALEAELLRSRSWAPKDVLLKRDGLYWKAYALEPEGPTPIPHRSRHADQQTVGYGGSGPAALAENILRYFTGRAGDYQALKWDVIANLDPIAEEHRIPAETIARYLPPLEP